jgi:hypothetical protein
MCSQLDTLTVMYLSTVWYAAHPDGGLAWPQRRRSDAHQLRRQCGRGQQGECLSCDTIGWVGAAPAAHLLVRMRNG